jgi:hypothetical protein
MFGIHDQNNVLAVLSPCLQVHEKAGTKNGIDECEDQHAYHHIDIDELITGCGISF